jgi:hypothetical protein
VIALWAALSLGFDWTGGYAPLDLGGTPPAPESCRSCHEEIYDAWRGSRHRASWTNDLLQVGFAAEPLDFCIHCHAPLPDQKAAIAANRDWYRSMDPRSGIVAGSVEKRPEPLSERGVDCAACHWREGHILAGQAGGAAHPVVAEPALASGEMCLGCHDFAMPVTVDGQTVPTTVAMQETGAQWRTWGGGRSCVDCHLAGHAFPGAHDRAFLARSVAVALRDGALHLRAVGVGHRLPTGDLFRRITVEVAPVAGPFRVIASLGRTFALDAGPEVTRKVPIDDTSLLPDEDRAIPLPADAARWRVVWHDGAPHDEARGLLEVADITAVLASGETR